MARLLPSLALDRQEPFPPGKNHSAARLSPRHSGFSRRGQRALLEIRITATALLIEDGHMQAIATTERARLNREKAEANKINTPKEGSASCQCRFNCKTSS